LQQMDFFKVWNIQKDLRYIDITTYSTRVNSSASNPQAQVDIKVLEGKDSSSAVVKIRITPTLLGPFSLYDIATNVDVSV
jgi:hypothetical protein